MTNKPTPPAAASPEPGAVDALVRRIAAEAYKHWDADRDSKVGKLLAALAGTTGIRLDLDGVRAAAPRATEAELGAVNVRRVESILRAFADAYTHGASRAAAYNVAIEALGEVYAAPRADATADDDWEKWEQVVTDVCNRLGIDPNWADSESASPVDCIVAAVEMDRAKRADATAGVVNINTPMPEHFREYVERNYPPGVVIGNPAWHAPKLWGAALYALRAAQPDGGTHGG